MRKAIAAAILLLAGVAGVTASKPPDPIKAYLRVAADSITVKSGSFLATVPVAQLRMHDTVNTYDEKPMIFVSGTDSVVVECSADAVTIGLVRPTDTMQLVVRFMGWYVHREPKLKLLREFNQFERVGAAEIPAFAYPASTDSHLTNFRTTFGLDSVMGAGGEGSQIENLLGWVHRRIKHDGQHEEPAATDPVEIIKICDSEQRGLHCGALAGMLCQAYLACGFTARVLACLPFDTADGDCHSVVMVWSETMGKWVLTDPTYNVRVTDTAGNWMSPLEFRAALERGDSVGIWDAIDYNGDPYSKHEYLGYMAKNLFRFRSGLGPVKSEGPKSVVLDPIGYSGSRSGETQSTVIMQMQVSAYITHDADWFFGRP